MLNFGVVNFQNLSFSGLRRKELQHKDLLKAYCYWYGSVGIGIISQMSVHWVREENAFITSTISNMKMMFKQKW